MTAITRSTVPIASTAELSLWWAEVLSEDHLPDPALALLWLDPLGHRLGRCLRISGVPPVPDRRTVSAVLDVHRGISTVAEADVAHLAIALTRPGSGSVTTDDEEWADGLDTVLDGLDKGSWSLHLAAGGWITPIVSPPVNRFDPRRVAFRPPSELLDRTWLLDQNVGHDDPPARPGQSPLQPGHR